MKLKRKMFAGPFAASTFGRIIGANNWSNIGHLMSGKVNQATNLATRQSVKINPVTNKGAGTIAGNLVKGIAKPAALVGTAATVAGLGAKGVVSKASEQSDGSRVFSDIEIMKTYTLKRKTFTDFSKYSTEKLEKIAAQTTGAGNTIVENAKRELASRVPLTNVVTTPKPKPNSTTTGGLRAGWNKLGTAGKVGIIGAGVIGTGLLANSMLNNKKKEQ